MAYILNPPTVDETPAGFGRLFWRYRVARGDSLLVYGTSVTRTRTPSVQECEDADYVYLGGHVYDISPEERNILVDAGYGAYITEV